MATDRIIAVFGSSASQPGDSHYEDGLRCGRLLAEAGYGVATGGYGGIMAAVSHGARTAGAKVIGVTAPPVFPGREGANEHLTEERPAATLTERIHAMLELSDGAIALHGSIGTATELLVAWNLAFVAPFSQGIPRPVIAVGPRWKRIVADLVEELATDGSLVVCVDSVDDAVDLIRERLPLD